MIVELRNRLSRTNPVGLCNIFRHKNVTTMQANTFHNDDPRSGCTPPVYLFTSEYRTGRYPYYILTGGPNGGIYIDWYILQFPRLNL